MIDPSFEFLHDVYLAQHAAFSDTHNVSSLCVSVYLVKTQEITLEKNLSLLPVGKETRNRAKAQTLLIPPC